MKNTRAILDAIHDGSLLEEEYTIMPIFGFSVPKKVSKCNTEILNPRESWQNKVIYFPITVKIRLIMITI